MGPNQLTGPNVVLSSRTCAKLGVSISFQAFLPSYVMLYYVSEHQASISRSATDPDFLTLCTLQASWGN